LNNTLKITCKVCGIELDIPKDDKINDGFVIFAWFCPDCIVNKADSCKDAVDEYLLKNMEIKNKC